MREWTSEDGRVRLINGDCLDVLPTLGRVDACVTDPPYGLSFMGKKWDYDVPNVAIWQECLSVLKPGGHLLAFSGTRTQHRMAVRIEDAGFEIRDMIAWVYGSGFPKSLDVSKAIDKAAGAEREVVGKREGGAGKLMEDRPWNVAEAYDKTLAITAPATEAAQQWNGWGTALKPAMEPITVARKPFPGTVAANVLEWGTGGMNVDGCRVGTEERLLCHNGQGRSANTYGGGWENYEAGSGRQYREGGRWPANFIHDGSDEVVGLFPNVKTGTIRPHNNAGSSFQASKAITGSHKGDSGSAARFFYCAKASKVDRDEGCEGPEYVLNSDCPPDVKIKIEALLTSMR